MLKLRLAGIGVLLALAAIFAVASLLNSERLDAVTVRFIGPGSEPEDAVVLGLGKENAKPDYRLDVVHTDGRLRCGTVLNTSAVPGIRFGVTGDIPLRRTQELILIEEDKLNDDVLTRAQFASPSVSSDGYAFTSESSRSFAVGMAWFFGTALGKIIGAGILIAVVLIAISAFAG